MPSLHKKSFAAEQLARRKKKVNPVVWVIVGIVVVVLVVGGYVLYQRSVKQKHVETEQINSIAVLPFIDMSPGQDQQYLGNGIADYIINKLTQIDSLRVIDRTSSFQFRDKEDAIDEIGDKLNVDTILEGSVQQIGDELMITAQLIRVRDHSHLFSKEFKREFRDLITVQNEISQAVAEILKGTLKEYELRALVKRYTEDAEAYRLVMMADESVEKSEYKKALEYAFKAVEKDPEFAYANAFLAGLYAVEEKVDSAKIFVDKALELDNNLYLAYDARALIHFRECNYSDALSALKTAQSLNPGDEWAHIWQARFMFYLGRYNEALREAHIAMELNPLDASPQALAIAINNNLDRYEDALEIYRKANELIPDNGYILRHLGRLYYRRGEYDKALEVLQKDNSILHNTLHIGITYALMGEREKALQILHELEADNKSVELLYITLGDYETALDLLEQAINSENRQIPVLYCDFEFDPVRDNPRFKALVKKMGLPED